MLGVLNCTQAYLQKSDLNKMKKTQFMGTEIVLYLLKQARVMANGLFKAIRADQRRETFTTERPIEDPSLFHHSNTEGSSVCVV